MVLAVGIEGEAGTGVTGGAWTVVTAPSVAAARDEFERADCVVTAASLPDG